jgi:hypothetical protein
LRAAASPESVPVSPESALTAGAVLASDDVGGGGWYNPASLGVWTPYHDYDGGSTTITSSGAFPGTPTLNTTYAATYSFTERRDDTWAGLAVGWQATRRLRVGGMLQGAYSTDVWTVDLNTSLKPDSTDPAQSGSHLVYSERGDQGVIGLRTLFGLQWDAMDAVRVAAAVRGPTIRVAGWGPVNKFVSYGIVMQGTTA